MTTVPSVRVMVACEAWLKSMLFAGATSSALSAPSAFEEAARAALSRGLRPAGTLSRVKASLAGCGAGMGGVAASDLASAADLAAALPSAGLAAASATLASAAAVGFGRCSE